MSASVEVTPLKNESPPISRVRLRFPLRTTVMALLAAVVAYAAAWLGHAIVLSGQGVSVLWPANALLVSLMLLVPRKSWPVLVPAGLVGFIVRDLQFGFAPLTIAQLILADSIEILIVGLSLGYYFNGIPRLSGTKELAKYSFFAVLLGPFVSGFFVAAAVPGPFIVNWRIWFFSQTLAFLTLTPAVLSWANPDCRSRFRHSAHTRVEAAALLGGLAILGCLVLLTSWRTMPAPLATLGLYALVHVESRFLGAAVVILWSTLFVAVRLPRSETSERISASCLLAVSIAIVVTLAAESAKNLSAIMKHPQNVEWPLKNCQAWARAPVTSLPFSAIPMLQTTTRIWRKSASLRKFPLKECLATGTPTVKCDNASRISWRKQAQPFW